MDLEKFHLPFQGMSRHSLECKTERRQRQKKPLGPRGKIKNPLKKNCRLEISFCRLGGGKCRLEKNCRLENFTCHSGGCPDISWNARPKNGRGGKYPIDPRGGGKGLLGKKLSVGNSFVGWGKKCRLENKFVGVPKRDQKERNKPPSARS